MTTPDECRQFAEEYRRWAGSAKDDKERKMFLELARLWTTKAAAATNEVATTDVPLQPAAAGPESVHRRGTKSTLRYLGLLLATAVGAIGVAVALLAGGAL